MPRHDPQTPSTRRSSAASRRRWTGRSTVAGALGLTIVALGVAPLAHGQSAPSTSSSKAALHAGTYTGDVVGYGDAKRVTLVVARNGTGRVQVQCGGTSAGTAAPVSTAGGHLSVLRRGSTGQEDWALQGTRTALGDAPDVIAVNLVLPRACDSIGGTGFLSAT